MGKIRTRALGLEEVEKEQKQEQKRKSQQKKSRGERLAAVEVNEESLKKMEKAKKILEEKPASSASWRIRRGKTKKVTIHVRGKKYQEAKKLINKTKTYNLKEALDLLKKVKLTKFDQSVELHLNVNETGLRGEIELPHSTGKTLRIAVVDDKIISNIEKGKIDFDILITHPSFMPKLAKFAKVLGPKGLMPNPKTGTISTDPETVVKKFSRGVLRWKTEAKFPLIHQMIGKISFDGKALEENAARFIQAVGKGHIQKAFIKITMSPAIKIDVEKI